MRRIGCRPVGCVDLIGNLRRYESGRGVAQGAGGCSVGAIGGAYRKREPILSGQYGEQHGVAGSADSRGDVRLGSRDIRRVDGGDQRVRLIGAAFAQRIRLRMRVDCPVDGNRMHGAGALREKGKLYGGEAGRNDVIEGEILVPQRDAVEGLNFRRGGGDGAGGGGGRKCGIEQHRMIEEADLRGGVVFEDAIERGPIDPVVFGRIDGLDCVAVQEIEVEREARQIEIGQIFDQRVLVIVVGVVEDRHGEIGRIAKSSADGEAIGRCRVNAGSGGEGVEPSKINRSVGL